MTHKRANPNDGKLLKKFEERTATRNGMALETIRYGVIAGAAGGLAEIAWVALYAVATGGNAAILARGVTTAAGVSALFPVSALGLGVAVHMTLAVMLGVALAFAWRAFSAKRGGSSNPYPLMLAALAGVWAINFFVVLPLVSPAFIHLVPYAVSLTSKLLFGLAAAAVLRRQDETALNARPAVSARSA
jgi:hypothetical protein